MLSCLLLFWWGFLCNCFPLVDWFHYMVGKFREGSTWNKDNLKGSISKAGGQRLITQGLGNYRRGWKWKKDGVFKEWGKCLDSSCGPVAMSWIQCCMEYFQNSSSACPSCVPYPGTYCVTGIPFCFWATLLASFAVLGRWRKRRTWTQPPLVSCIILGLWSLTFMVHYFAFRFYFLGREYIVCVCVEKFNTHFF